MNRKALVRLDQVLNYSHNLLRAIGMSLGICNRGHQEPFGYNKFPQAERLTYPKVLKLPVTIAPEIILQQPHSITFNYYVNVLRICFYIHLARCCQAPKKITAAT